MKRVFLALFLLAFILSVGTWEQVYITGTFDGLKEEITNVKSLIEEKTYGEAEEIVQKCAEKWRKKEDMLELLAPHTDIKDMIVHVSQLNGMLLAELYDDALAQTVMIIELCDSRKELMSFRWENII